MKSNGTFALVESFKTLPGVISSPGEINPGSVMLEVLLALLTVMVLPIDVYSLTVELLLTSTELSVIEARSRFTRELTSNTASSVDPGTPAPPAPPEVAAQFAALLKLPLEAPTQYRVAAWSIGLIDKHREISR